jgi:hypothetical protein
MSDGNQQMHPSESGLVRRKSLLVPLAGVFIVVSLQAVLAAEPEKPGQFGQQMIPLEFEGVNIEASGIVWDEKTGSYLLVSDEAIDGETLVFRVDENGQITETQSIADKKDVDDLESISIDGEYAYLLSSLSPKRNKKLKRARKQFVRLQYAKTEFVSNETVNLYKVLKKISKDKNIETTTRKFLARRIAKQRLEIEAHAVREEMLYLGFKQPDKKDGDCTILRVSNIDQIFSGEYLDAKIWQIFRLTDPDSGDRTFLTDMAFSADQLYLLSVSDNTANQGSYLWRYDLTTEKLMHLMSFPNLIAEGISISGKRASIVFDGGSVDPSYFLKVKI